MHGTARRIGTALLLAASATALQPWQAAAQAVVRLPADDRPLALRPTPIFEVGKAEGAEWETFANVMAMAFDGEDNLYVLDAGNHRVLVFDSEGRHVRSFGRQGGGPGEFGMPMGVAIAANGDILVADAMRSVLHRFARDGEPLPSFDLGSMLLAGQPAAHPTRGVVGTARTAAPAAPPAPGERPAPRQRELRWWPGDGGDARLLYRAPPLELSSVGTQQIRMDLPRALSPALNWAVMPDGSVAVNAVEEYRIEIIGEDGRARRVIERPIAARPITERDRQAYRESRGTPRLVLGGVSSADAPGAAAMAQLQESLANVEFHDRLQVIRQFAVDPFGRLWVSRREDAVALTGPIDIIDAAGSYLGTLPAQPLPAAFSRSGRVAFVERDEYDIQRVVVRQVPSAR